MDLVIYDNKNRENVICVYYNCELVPHVHDIINIGKTFYEVISNPCFSYDTDTVLIFVCKR